MLVGRVAAAVDGLAFLVERSLFGEVRCAAMQIGDAAGDHRAFGVAPRTGANAVTRIDGRGPTGCLRRQIGPPGPAAGAARLGEALADRICAVDSPEISPLPEPTLVTKKVISAV